MDSFRQHAPKRSELERRIIAAEAKGQDWARAHEIWLQLDSDEKNYLMSLMLELKSGKDGKVSQSELEMEARASKEFRDYCKRVTIARGEELRAKVRYENSRDWYEAARSAESTERERMRQLKDIP